MFALARLTCKIETFDVVSGGVHIIPTVVTG